MSRRSEDCKACKYHFNYNWVLLVLLLYTFGVRHHIRSFFLPGETGTKENFGILTIILTTIIFIIWGLIDNIKEVTSLK